MLQILEQTHEEKVKMYMKLSKKELLKEVLETHYKTDKRFVGIIEYPELKRY